MDRITDLCRQYGVAELAVFGSAVRDDCTPASDVDFLVLFKNDDDGPWMSRLTELERELTRVLGRRAEVVPKNTLKWVIRDRVLSQAETLYVDAN